jgi:L-fuculose-phosphate aldolase
MQVAEMNGSDHRAQVIDVARALDAAGLVPNKSGNVSCRVDGGFAITPAGVPYCELQPAQIVTLALDVVPGVAAAGGVRPSSEWRMHAAVYRARADVAAVVHTHSPRATALACAGRGIPPFHYMIALAGGDIRCTPYSTFGTAELAQSAVQGLQGRRACLLGNHGVMAVGTSLARAHAVAIEVENLAGAYLDLLAAGLEPDLLDEAEIRNVVARFTDYGRLD